MADFRTHITVSSAVGIAYGGGGYFWGELPAGVCMLSAGLCGVSGMLPDLDSDSGVPLRESVTFAGAVVPMLMIPRWRTLGLSPEHMVLAGAFVYLIVRFGLGWLLKKYTVHRGMFHSLPAAVIAAEVAFLIYSRKDLGLRYFVSGAVFFGFMSHLLLDEVWSVGVKRGQIAVKKSFGTAVKFWGNNTWANVSCYGKLIALSFLVLHDPIWMYGGESPVDQMRQFAQRIAGDVKDRLANRTRDAEEPAPLEALPNDRFSAPGNHIAPGYLDPRSARNYVQPGTYQQPGTYGRPSPPARFEPNAPQYPPQYQQQYPQQPYAPQQQYVPQQYQYQGYQQPQPYQNNRWIYQR